MDMRRILLTAGLMMTAAAAYSIPAKPGMIRYVQPDGTEVEIRMAGDEHGHITFSAEGLVVVANSEGRLEYARFNQDGRPVASGIALSKTKLSDAEKLSLQTQSQIEHWISTVESQKADKLAKRAALRRAAAEVDPDEGGSEEDEEQDDEGNGTGQWSVPANFGLCTSTFPIKGSPKGLVLLVEYQDVPFEYGDYDYFNRMLNEEGFSDYGSLGSARDYFVDNSMGQFTPDFDVYGPVTLPNVRAYYGANNESGDDERPYLMAVHAMQALDDEVDFTQYDCDGDGMIDNVFVFYAGQGEHDSGIRDAVWPHSWEVSAANPFKRYKFDDVVLDHYACTCEHPTGETRPDGIGTFVHEFSHVMGLPDLYVTTYSGGFTPGSYQVLDEGPYNNGGLTPPNYSSFERCALGWIEMTPMQEGRIEIPELTESNVAYVVPTENKGEYFFFENRQRVGNDRFIPGHGMLVWHIDYDRKIWDYNAVNNTSSHQRVDIVEADNVKTESTRAGDTFPGTSGVTAFLKDSKPAMVSWKKKNLIFELTDIQETEDGLIIVEANSLATEKPPYSDSDAGVGAIGGESEYSDDYYDLLGRKVTNPQKGIYIRNGKKEVVR